MKARVLFCAALCAQFPAAPAAALAPAGSADWRHRLGGGEPVPALPVPVLTEQAS